MKNTLAITALLLACITSARADNAELNEMLELNATGAAYARLCGEEPTSDQLKSSTMLVLALSGIDAQAIQLGSAKFNDVMRQIIRSKVQDLDCKQQMRDANTRLRGTQELSMRLRGSK